MCVETVSVDQLSAATHLARDWPVQSRARMVLSMMKARLATLVSILLGLELAQLPRAPSSAAIWGPSATSGDAGGGFFVAQDGRRLDLDMLISHSIELRQYSAPADTRSKQYQSMMCSSRESASSIHPLALLQSSEPSS